MNCSNKTIKDMIENFSVLCSIIRQERDPILEQRLSKLSHIIHNSIPQSLGKNAPPNFYEFYEDFTAEYNKLRDFILYDKLIGKNVVALGGGFSSGKSSFLNALDHETPLPENIDPSTSVPTYVVNGTEHKVFGINIFDTRVEIDRIQNIRRIAHGFGHIEDEDGNEITAGTTLGHILESVFLASPKQVYENIAFLDTPGYSKPDSEKYSARTDEQIARQQLNSSDFILWFINANRGTIPEEDIKFIKGLHDHTPKLIIMTRAGEKAEDIELIREEIKSKLIQKGIQIVDVCAFEKNDPDGFDADKIHAYLKKWNQSKVQTKFALNFKKLFIECRKFYEQRIEESQKELEALNKAALQGESEIVRNILEHLRTDVVGEIKDLKDAEKGLTDLQGQFFEELKRVGDSVGIALEEPSEAEFQQLNRKDTLELVRAYEKKNGIRTDPDIPRLLLDTFRDIKPVYNGLGGTAGYRDELMQIMSETCSVPPEEILFMKNKLCDELTSVLMSAPQLNTAGCSQTERREG